MRAALRALISKPMRSRSLAAILALLLTACVPALVMPSTTQLMLALLRPLVGLDPNAVNLYEQPLIKSRMTALLGEHYTTALTLLRTADALQREGPLFFVVSRYTPVPELAERAGLVWNADTNQMAVAILRGDGAQVFSEVVQRRVAAIEDKAVEATIETAVDTAVDTAVSGVAPRWPTVMQAWLETATGDPPATEAHGMP